MKTFITGLATEFQKITWPKTSEAFGHAALVIGIALLVGYYLGLWDAVFAFIIKTILM